MISGGAGTLRKLGLVYSETATFRPASHLSRSDRASIQELLLQHVKSGWMCVKFNLHSRDQLSCLVAPPPNTCFTALSIIAARSCPRFECVGARCLSWAWAVQEPQHPAAASVVWCLPRHLSTPRPLPPNGEDNSAECRKAHRGLFKITTPGWKLLD